MPGALRGIDQCDGANRARFLTKLGHGIDRAERVRDVGEGEEFHFGGEECGELIERERAVIADRDEAEPERRFARPGAARGRGCCGAPFR